MEIIVYLALLTISGFTVWMLWQFAHEWKDYAKPKK